MPTIKVPRLGQRETPITHEGWKSPEVKDDHILYEVTKMQEFYWMGLTRLQRRELILQADEQKKDLRELL